MSGKNFYVGYNTDFKQFLLLKTSFNWKWLSKNPEYIYDVNFIYEEPRWYIIGLDNIKKYLNSQGMSIDVAEYMDIEPMCWINGETIEDMHTFGRDWQFHFNRLFPVYAFK